MIDVARVRVFITNNFSRIHCRSYKRINYFVFIYFQILYNMYIYIYLSVEIQLEAINTHNLGRLYIQR